MISLVYISAPWEMRDHARALRAQLHREHIAVQARWLDDDAIFMGAGAAEEKNAKMDLFDIRATQAIVMLNPEEFARQGTGGRHVEFGYAMAIRRVCILFGAKTNVFHHLDGVHYAPHYQELILMLSTLRPLEDNVKDR